MKKKRKSGSGKRINSKNNNTDASVMADDSVMADVSVNPDASVNTETSVKVPVIGIGASAGGLKALRTFFDALPEDSGMSFVVVVHLSPEHKSSMAELLQAKTKMPVTQVTKTTRIKPNHVYVIPPNKRLVANDQELKIQKFNRPRGSRATIDLFFRSLAISHGDGAVLIFSGGGTDGSVGIKSIKEAGGLILVQDPQEAEYDSMPRAAIATGLVDMILPVREMARQLVELKQRSVRLTRRLETLGNTQDEMLRTILGQLRARVGHDFSMYKKSTILRRIQRRMQVTGNDEPRNYHHFLRQNSDEARELFSDLLIGVTNFFRDPEAFDKLKNRVIPRLFEGKGANDVVRVWVVGCSTGEEAYSLAILLRECANDMDVQPKIQIFASDIDEDGLAAAREGFYPLAIEADVNEERLRRYFVKDGNHYRIHREVREMVLFSEHSVLRDPPFSRLDLVSCRNFLIYLQREPQENVFNIFHYALGDEGYLFLGSSETADNITNLFKSVDKQHRIFQVKKQNERAPKLLSYQPDVRDERELKEIRSKKQPTVPEVQLHSTALEEFAPPSVLVDENNKIIHLSERAGRYLLHPGGKPTSDITRIVRPELRTELRSALFQAFEADKATVARRVKVQFNGHSRIVFLTVRPARQENDSEKIALVSFDEGDETTEAAVTKGVSPSDKVRLKDELNHTRQRLQTVVEEFESSREELRAQNEELMSINEEYKSTMEELETSKEEIESVNEELQTVNQEFKEKIEETSKAHSDLHNLVMAIDIGILFLNRQLQIERFTPQAEELFNIRQIDRGRPLSDITHRLNYKELDKDARQVLLDLTIVEREIQDNEGRWYLVRMRPYRTVDDKINGVVITFYNISKNKWYEKELERDLANYKRLQDVSVQLIDSKKAKALYEKILDTAVAVSRADFASMQMFHPDRGKEGELFLMATRAFKREVKEAWQWLKADSKTGSGRVLETGRRVIVPDVEKDEYIKGSEAHKTYKKAGVRAVVNTPLFSRSGRFLGVISIHWKKPYVPGERELHLVDVLARQAADLIERIQYEEVLKQSEERFRTMVESATEYAIFTLDLEGKINSWNTGAEHLLGWTEKEALGRKVTVIFPPESGETDTRHEMRIARETGTAKNERWHVKKDGSRFWANEMMMPMKDSDGEISGYVKILQDQTERKEAEETNNLLLGELDHRLKNTLATIQSIAYQTMHQTDSTDEFVEKFNGRLHALAQAHSLLTESSWIGANFDEILQEQLTIQGIQERMTGSGPEVMISPKASLHIALVLHELITNAIKYGSLSSPLGRVSVNWKIEKSRKEPILKINWIESKGPKVKKPEKSGFGKDLIEHSLASVRGQSRLRFESAGLRCEITLPLDGNLDNEGGKK